MDNVVISAAGVKIDDVVGSGGWIVVSHHALEHFTGKLGFAGGGMGHTCLLEGAQERRDVRKGSCAGRVMDVEAGETGAPVVYGGQRGGMPGIR